jgi:hypothetical protein
MSNRLILLHILLLSIFIFYNFTVKSYAVDDTNNLNIKVFYSPT